ncbi:phosphatase [Neokomagataea thailandica NBRC 106555]|uniref:HAD family phosphatase n=2 Tax=Neokomagataea TaxID=1223423 RepID=A0A4Y6V7Q9_9PROT|nr:MULTISPECIES: HAD family phosphatase [Neokomagataea]QDH24671.1 HAD family phosphatase [Neokomagataea tanensis]GBR53874.1 phosphatase [Neokomagataea thailandica NBRC 106555]
MTALDPSGRLELIIFDCDGVLVDSEVASCQATAQYARSLGLELTDEEAHKRFVGMALPDVVRDLEHELDRKLPENTALILRENLVRLMEKMAEPVSGSVEMLEEIRRLRMPVRVGSNSSIQEMEAKFSRTRMTGFFPENRIHSATDMKQPKPSPAVYLYAAEQEGRAPENCLVIEDSDPGAEAAWRAGMSCILLRDEGQPLPSFWPQPGFVRIAHLSELAPLVETVITSQGKKW